jgi:hypothetical protein
MLLVNDTMRKYEQDWPEQVESRKKDECRSRLFGTGSKEKVIMVDHGEDII